MNRIKKSKRLLLASTLTIIAIAVSYFAVSSILNTGAAIAQEEGKVQDNWSVETVQDTWIVETVEEAECIAGYPVVTPGCLPESLLQQSHSIQVSQPMSDHLPKRVIQMWGSVSSQQVVFLIQDPELDGMGGGEPFQVGEIICERWFREADDERPALLAFYWRDGDMAYNLCGTLTGPVDEDMMIEMMLSTKIDK
jgi:hypothetical protein